MADHPLDPERLAALLDDRLSAEDRAALLALLAQDSAAREILADASAVLDEVADRTATVPERPLARPATRRCWPVLVLAAAASVAVVTMRQRATVARDAIASTALVSPAAVTTLALAPEARDALVRARWSVVRGSAAPLSSTARAVRLGALAVDAFLDRETIGGDARAEMATLLEPIAGGGPARRLLAEAQDSASMATAVNAARALVSADAFDVGVWLELLRADAPAARTASVAITVLQRTLDTADLAPDRAALAREQVMQLRERLAGEASGSLRAPADALLALLAS
jgi:hypothetical protein